MSLVINTCTVSRVGLTDVSAWSVRYVFSSLRSYYVVGLVNSILWLPGSYIVNPGWFGGRDPKILEWGRGVAGGPEML